MKEYSVEWFKHQRDTHKEWLGTQALRLLEHYEKLEADLRFLQIQIQLMLGEITQEEFKNYLSRSTRTHND